MYKLKVYNEKCKFDHEEFFTTLKEMDKRYMEIIEKRDIAPTAWECIKDKWCRIAGY